MGKSEQEQCPRKQSRQYQKIDKDQRREVLKLLINDKFPLQEVATRLGLKYCTVRTIQKSFEREGRIGKKETRKQKVKLESIINISIMNPFTCQLSPIYSRISDGNIYIDRNPNLIECPIIIQESNSMFMQQWAAIQASIYNSIKPMHASNLFIYHLLQNLLFASQTINKSPESKPQIIVKLEQDNQPQEAYQSIPVSTSFQDQSFIK